MQPIDKIKQVLGSQAALATALDVSRMTVTKWKGRIPAERVLPIYHATEGQISPHEMRPDIYPDPAWRP
jgi:DNA-binding transcriptional regulator YdaS (Cro superfamily)